MAKSSPYHLRAKLPIEKISGDGFQCIYASITPLNGWQKYQTQTNWASAYLIQNQFES
jgi:hypothetical protein